MLIKRFEDIDVWKESRKLVNMVYDLTNKNIFKQDFGLREQIQRAAVSCMLNAAEGFDSDTKQQFIQMLSYTKRSSSEVQSVLYIALDRKYIGQQEFENIYNQAQSVGKLANGFIRHLKGNRCVDLPANRLTGSPVNPLTGQGILEYTLLFGVVVAVLVLVLFKDKGIKSNIESAYDKTGAALENTVAKMDSNFFGGP